MQIKKNATLFRTLTAGALVLGMSVVTACSNNDDSANDDPRDDRTGQMSEPGDHTVVVLPYKATCVGEMEQLCYIVRVDGSDNEELVYQEIEGLNWRWGERVTARITTTVVPNPPQDSSDRKFAVARINSRQEVGEDETFQID